MRHSPFCDRLTRRNVLRAGVAGTCGLSLAKLLNQPARAATDGGRKTAKNAIYLYLPGGMSHLDTFDMKPECDAAEVRGEFQTIDTALPGVQFCELLPQLAQQADKITLLRNCSHSLATHPQGQAYMRSGNRPVPSLDYPCYGSILSKELPSPPDVPPFVSLPIARTNGGVETAGYLGVRYSSFSITEDPNANNFTVRALARSDALTAQRIEARRDLLHRLDRTFERGNAASSELDGMNAFYQKAYDILESATVRRAFDLASVPDRERERYGRTPYGQACLLARRLIESGVRCVAIDYGSWDTHIEHYPRMKKMLPVFDAGVAALLDDLYESGLLDETVVWCTGEFGRTPKMNDRGGRDHWTRAFSMFMAGGPFHRGRVIGRTDARGEESLDDPFSPDDAGATFLSALGIDHHKEYRTPSDRPVEIIRDGTPIRAAFQ